MSVFRVEKNKGYTVMSNHHLCNRTLSLKAKGLLSQMLSLPDDWDYTLQGLAQINKESIDAIREAVRELERAGYIKRSRERDERGCLRGTVYTIYEQPHAEPTPEEPAQEKPALDNPTLEKPMLDFPTLENPTQLITKDTTKYSRTLRFSDINYAIASKEDKTAMFLGYSELLNALDSGSTTKLTICNKQVNRQAFEDMLRGHGFRQSVPNSR